MRGGAAPSPSKDVSSTPPPPGFMTKLNNTCNSNILSCIDFNLLATKKIGWQSDVSSFLSNGPTVNIVNS